jgi:hypothetical protein
MMYSPPRTGGSHISSLCLLKDVTKLKINSVPMRALAPKGETSNELSLRPRR